MLSLSFYQQFFKVSQQQVVQRIKLSLNPTKREFIQKIKFNPDLYGPFWILTTLIFLLGSVGNLKGYLTNSSSKLNFKVEAASYGVLLVYPLGLSIPTIIYYTCKWMGRSKIKLPHLICIYGYSFSCCIIVFLLNVIPNELIVWISMIYGLINTVSFLILNLREYLQQFSQKKRSIIIGMIVVGQIVVLISLKVIFLQAMKNI